jgi:hypothetical protein
MEHILIATLAAAVIFLLNCKVIVLRTSVRTKVFRLTVQAGKAAGQISGEVGPAVRSIRQRDDVSKRLQTAEKAVESDLSSALIGLGCDKQKAREVAKKAIVQAPDFDSRLRWAIQNAA